MPPIEVTRFDDHITKLWVAGYVNVVLVRFGHGFVLLDSGFQDSASQLDEKLENLGASRIEFLVNTHENRDHTGGNALIGSGSTIVSHENCRRALTEQAFPEAGLPTVTFSDSLLLTRGSDRIELTAMPGGHTDGDAIAFLPRSGVVYLGDIIVPEAFPLVWLEFEDEVGVEQLIRVLDGIIGMFPDDVHFLSAHGPDYTKPDLRRYRDMVDRTVDLVRGAMAAGDTAERMKSQGLLDDWNSWDSHIYDVLNTDNWIDTIHESLRRSSRKE